MNDAYRPRVDALKYLTDHPTCILKTVFSACDFPIDLTVESHKSILLVSGLFSAGAIKVEILDHDPGSNVVVDEIFVTLPDPLPRVLMLKIIILDPDEFDEIEPNVFRLWWD